jgi:hypothetical protein
MNVLCEKLVTTYNANVLNDSPKELQEAFYNEAKKFANEPDCMKGRKVLMSLINNYFQKTPPTPKFIGGPKSLTHHWSEDYQKSIYIFGENHSPLMDCDDRFGKKAKKEQWGINKLSIEDFFVLLIKTTSAFIDLYIEFPAYKGLEYNSIKFGNQDIRLQKLLDRFQKCVEYSNRAAEDCRLARVHYFDIRSLKDGRKLTQSVDLFESKFSNIMNKYPKFEWAYKFRTIINHIKNKYIKDIWKGLAKTNDEDFLNSSIKKELDSNVFIQKELGKIKDKLLRDKIIIFIQNEFLELTKRYRKRWQHNVPIILKTSDEYSTKDNALIAAINDILLTNTTIIMRALVADTYLLARVFKDFNMKEIEEKGYKGATDQPDKAHNIIIYAGNAHSEVYRKFLNQLDFEQIAETGVSSNEFVTCVNMKKINQPLFKDFNMKEIEEKDTKEQPDKAHNIITFRVLESR